MSGHAVVGAVTRRRKSNDADRFRQITQSDWLYAARQQHSVARRYRRVTGHRQAAAAAYNSRLRNELTRVCGPHNGRTVTVVYFVVSAAREIFDVERKKTRLASNRVDSFQLHLRQLTKGSGLFSGINSLCPVVNFTPVSLPLTRFSNFITIFSADSPLSPPKTLLFSPSF